MRSFLVAMVAVLCVVGMVVPASAQIYSYDLFDSGAIYSSPVSYSYPVSYAAPATYSYSLPVSSYYSSPVSSTKGRFQNGKFYANDSSKYDQCPQCGKYHLPKGSVVTGVWQKANSKGVYVSYPTTSKSYVSYPTASTSYVSYPSSRSSGGCVNGFCP